MVHRRAADILGTWQERRRCLCTYVCMHVCMYYLDMYIVAQLLCNERDERRLERASGYRWISRCSGREGVVYVLSIQ